MFLWLETVQVLPKSKYKLINLYFFMFKDSITPVILCGGKGSRLWPLSRESFPKQFLKLTDETNSYTCLQQTYKRIEDLDNLAKPIIICNEEHRFILAELIIGSKINRFCITQYFKSITSQALKAIIGKKLFIIKKYSIKDFFTRYYNKSNQK